jgi:hypothetical protein
MGPTPTLIATKVGTLYFVSGQSDVQAGKMVANQPSPRAPWTN